ncbi:MAG: NlpC/P60 family protein, partial [Cyanobacteria bacterium P01_A01_bin.70]
TTHVALYVGQGNYLHSSGRDHGRNGVGIDSIVNLQDPISYFYYRQLRGAGRVTRSYQPLGQPMPCR